MALNEIEGNPERVTNARLFGTWSQYNRLVNSMGKARNAVLLAIAAGSAIAFPSAAIAGASLSVMSVKASVSPSVVLKFQGSPMQLHVTEADIARGYIDVPGTDRLSIETDRTMQHLANIMVDYEPNPYDFTSIQVAARTLQTGEPGSEAMVAMAHYVNALPATAAGPSDSPQKTTQPDASVNTFDAAKSVSDRASVTSLSYRLMLPRNIKPGNISVPLTLSLQL